MVRCTNAGIAIINGHWWGRVERTPKDETWAPLGKVELGSWRMVEDWFRLCRWYFGAGILQTITGPIVTHNNTGEIIRIIERTPTVERTTPDAKTD